MNNNIILIVMNFPFNFLFINKLPSTPVENYSEAK